MQSSSKQYFIEGISPDLNISPGWPAAPLVDWELAAVGNLQPDPQLVLTAAGESLCRVARRSDYTCLTGGLSRLDMRII